MLPSKTRELHKSQKELEGRWAYEEGTFTKLDFTIKLGFTLLRNQENSYRGILIVVNSMSFDLKLQADGICTIAHCESTLKGGPREMMKAEKKFQKLLLLPGLHVEVSGDTLKLTGPLGSFRLVWKRE